jgi:DNA polymerase III sliding clamp (beta) subunit (PCNA family)
MFATAQISEIRDAMLGLKKFKGGNTDAAKKIRAQADAADGATGTLTLTSGYAGGRRLEVEIESATVYQSGAYLLDTMNLDKLARKLKKRDADLDVAFERDPADADGNLDAAILRVADDDIDYSRRELLTTPADDYSTLDIDPDGLDFQTAPDGAFQRLFDKLVEFASTDTGREALQYIAIDDENAAATDGHKLAQLDHDLDVERSMMVLRDSAKTAEYVFRVRCDDAPVEFATVETDGQQVTWTVLRKGAWTLYTPHGADADDMPDFEQVMPRDDWRENGSVTVDRSDLEDAHDLVSLTASSKTNHMRFTLDGDSLELYASDPSLGESREAVDVLDSTISGEAKAAFNVDYVGEIIGSTFDGADRLEWTVMDAVRPARVRDPEGDGLLVVIMPMRL